MEPQMDTAALGAFLVAEFPQVAEDFGIEALTPEGIEVRLKVAHRHLRPGSTV